MRTIQSTAKTFAIVAALAAGGMLVADQAEARSGKGGNFGSRGSKTFDAPPATKTAPNPGTVQKSITQPGAAGAAAGAATTASRFGGMKGLLMGGLIGAGLASMFGLGGGLASMLGFILQMALVAGIVMLVIAFFRSRSAANQPALAQATAGAARAPDPQANAYRANAAAGMGSAAPALAIVGDDYIAFERLLKEVQLAYANSDIKALGDRVTPEVLSQFAGELEDNKRRGVSNDLSEPKLLQGDLAESWREGSQEYATVAMRYEIIDATVDQKTGRVVAGSTTEPQEATELWTFVRPAGSGADKWELSAIQQA